MNIYPAIPVAVMAIAMGAPTNHDMSTEAEKLFLPLPCKLLSSL
jgi:hypothetical protein